MHVHGNLPLGCSPPSTISQPTGNRGGEAPVVVFSVGLPSASSRAVAEGLRKKEAPASETTSRSTLYRRRFAGTALPKGRACWLVHEDGGTDGKPPQPLKTRNRRTMAEALDGFCSVVVADHRHIWPHGSGLGQSLDNPCRQIYSYWIACRRIKREKLQLDAEAPRPLHVQVSYYS